MTASKLSRTRCAIYTRKSSEEGLDQAFNSLDAQREACAAYVLSQAGEGWSANTEAYDDGGFSGGTLGRPALQRLLADVASGRVDVVVVYKVDRLTRSLGDFARIVETLDAAGASFVLVTQAFNTTTSMGRLTLNVLLSFAQFEREVTGERIRDKIAASKARGMWMGGFPPLGYAAKDRELVLAPEEAQIVRHIFQRYLTLGSVNLLRAELARAGYRSKSWVSQSSRAHGGAIIGRGALFHMLSNRIYLGEIVHKGARHRGLHPAIIDAETFDAAQQALARRGGPVRRARCCLPARIPAAPLSGMIYDAANARMSPLSAAKRDGRRYRYYVSSTRQRGEAPIAGILHRAPAEAVEALVLQRAQAIELIAPGQDAPWAAIRTALKRVDVGARYVRITFNAAALPAGFDLDRAKARLSPGDSLAADSETLTVTVPISLSRRGLGKTITGPDGSPVGFDGKLDPALTRALAQAEAWKRKLISGELPSIAALAKDLGVHASHCERTLRLAFLAPDLKLAILDGRAPAGLLLQRLRVDGVPDLWSEQRRRLLA